MVVVAAGGGGLVVAEVAVAAVQVNRLPMTTAGFFLGKKAFSIGSGSRAQGLLCWGFLRS